MNEDETVVEGQAEEQMRSGRSFIVARHYSYDSDPVKGRYPGISEDDWLKMIFEMLDGICKSGDIEYMAHIVHDRDILKDGGLKPIHVHAFVRFKQSVLRTDVVSIFGASDRDENCQLVNNNLASALYLIHMSKKAREEEKTIYPIDDVFAFNCRYRDLIKESFWEKAENADDANKKMNKNAVNRLVTELGVKIRNGELRRKDALAELELKAGYYWVRQLRKSFDGDEEAFVDTVVERMVENGRDNVNLFVMGAGGTGKSNFARKLGVRLSGGKGLYVTAPLGLSKTPDAMNHYQAEMVAIFNEISPRGWSLDEFLACFDLYEYSPFPSRNINKHFVGNTCIFTNSISPTRFAKDLLIYSKGGSQYQDPANKRELDFTNPSARDKYWQVRRRFQSQIILIRDEVDATIVHAHIFNLCYGALQSDGSVNEDDGCHVWVGRVEFENAPKKEPVITSETLDEIERLMKIEPAAISSNSTTIDYFMERKGLTEPIVDPLIDDFIENVVSECVWDFLPTTFLYELYRKFRDKFYPTEDLMTVQEFTGKMDELLKGWNRPGYSVRVSGRMDKPEHLVYDYKMEDWGYTKAAYTRFNPRDQYKGYVRK